MSLEHVFFTDFYTGELFADLTCCSWFFVRDIWFAVPEHRTNGVDERELPQTSSIVYMYN